MRRNVYSWAVFTWVDLFAFKFYLNKVDSYQPFLASENKRHWATRWWKPHPSAFPCFDTTLECDGQTDRRICRSIYCACKASFAACCKNQTQVTDRQRLRRE